MQPRELHGARKDSAGKFLIGKRYAFDFVSGLHLVFAFGFCSFCISLCLVFAFFAFLYVWFLFFLHLFFAFFASGFYFASGFCII